MAGLTSDSVQKALIEQGEIIKAALESGEETEDLFHDRIKASKAATSIRSRLAGHGYILQSSLAGITQLMALLLANLIDMSDVILFISFLLVMGALPLGVATQSLRGKQVKTVKVSKNIQQHQVKPPQVMLDLMGAPLKGIFILPVCPFSEIPPDQRYKNYLKMTKRLRRKQHDDS